MQRTVRHIGLSVTLSQVDPLHYAAGWDGTLAGPENDAKLFETLLASAADSSASYELWPYATEKATRSAVINALDFAASRLADGSTLVVYVAAHGGQVPNLIDDGDPLDAIALYDGMLLDIELHELWCRFEPGVRIVMLADTCSSGTVGFFGSPGITRVARRMQHAVSTALGGSTSRGVPADILRQTFDLNRQQYEQYQVTAADLLATSTPLRASVLQIGACADGAEAFERGGTGVFTEALHATFSAAFTGSYRQLYESLRAPCAPQEPTYESSQPDSDPFSGLRAFSPSGTPAS
ncbi:MAG: caspase family protein [bacterium]